LVALWWRSRDQEAAVPEKDPPRSNLETQAFRVEDIMAKQAARKGMSPVELAAQILGEAEETARFVMDLPPAARDKDQEKLATAVLDTLEFLRDVLKKLPGAPR
jgi:hypothetical protein